MTRVPPRSVSSTPDGALEVRQGGGCLILFGLPFLAAGLLVLGGVLGLLQAPEDPLERAALGGMGLLFVAAGTTLILLRWGTTIDRERGEAVDWWRLAGAGRRRSQPLAAFTRAVLSTDSSGESVSYPVSLTGPGGVRFRFLDSGSLDESRRVGEVIADHLHLPFLDESLGVKVEREAGRLDESLAARARRTGRLTTPLPPPGAMRSEVHEAGDGIRIEIPGPSLGVALAERLGCAIVLLAVTAAMLASFVRSLRWSAWLPILAGFIVVPALLFGIAAASRRVVVRASRAGLRVEMRHALRRRIFEIPADELEELIVPAAAVAPPSEARRWLRGVGRTTAGITVRSDATSVSFGESLQAAEQSYLASRIAAALGA